MGIVPQTTQEYDKSIQQDEQAYQQRRQQAMPQTLTGLVTGEQPKPGMDWSRLAGNIVGTAPLAAMTGGTGLAPAMVQGGALASLQPITNGGDNFASEKGQQVATGALTAGALNRVGAGLARVLSPQTRPEIQTLLDAGITPTPGQMMGGMLSRAEEKLASVPLIGDAIRAGQNRANMQLNQAAINRALEPIGDKLPKGVTGREAIDYARRALGDSYDDVLNRMGAVRPDAQFGQDLTNLSGMTKNLPKDMSEQFTRIVKNEVLDRINPEGAMTSEGLKAAESNLGQIAKNYMRSGDYDQRQLGAAITEAQSTIRSMLERTAPEHAAELKAINTGWANFMRPQKAASMVGAEDGNFTAAQLQSAVKALDPSRNKGAFARGDALMQDLSDAAKSVLSSKVPNSGTVDRLAMGLLTAGGLGAVSPAALGAAGVGSLAYTPMGQKAIATLMTQRPDVAPQLAKLLLEMTPAISAAGAVAAPSMVPQ
jgi:hypothetical protein